MCLLTLKHEPEEDIYVPSRVYRRERETHYRSSSPRRSTHSHRTSVPTVVSLPPRPPSTVILPPRPPSIRIPPPTGKVLPAPQPVPIFETVPIYVEPSAPSPAPRPEVHYVHVSPRSSISDQSDYRYERREVRVERDYSPARSPRDDHYEYRYVQGDPPPRLSAPPRRERSRSRSRSRGRDYYEDDREERTNVRVSRKYA